jgi:hypothetical protein
MYRIWRGQKPGQIKDPKGDVEGPERPMIARLQYQGRGFLYVYSQVGGYVQP